MPIWHKASIATVATVLALGAGACGGSDEPSEVVLVTHDSFVISDEAKRDFEQESGLTLKVLKAGDAGEVVAKAMLTAGNPQGDVLFGIDNNLLSRALDGDLFEPYEATELETVDEGFALDPEHRVTPVDHGEVCLNYDKAWFAEREVPPPTSLDELVRPAYKDLLVVENPATSTPGLAFMLATIARYGDTAEWERYWKDLRENGVLVVDGWEEAYNVRFSGSAGKGDRPLVVSYASSPPVEVIYATPQPSEAPTGVVEASCFLQIEFAGILRGARNESGAEKLVDFLLSKRFQEDIPLSMFVFPVNRDAVLPAAFEQHAVVPQGPFELPPEQIEANRERWVDEWTNIVLR